VHVAFFGNTIMFASTTLNFHSLACETSAGFAGACGALKINFSFSIFEGPHAESFGMVDGYVELDLCPEVGDT
jgi:hypothetical protein